MRSKKYYLLLLFITGLLPGGNAFAKLEVFACEPEWAALAKTLGGEHLAVFSATTAMQDPHHIQARPSLIAKARSADLLVCSGAGLEAGWLPLLLRKSGNKNILTANGQLFAADHVDMLDIPAELDRGQGDIHAEGNPHVHTSPDNILKIAGVLAERLVMLDSQNANHYRSAYQSFDKNWSAMMKQWKQQSQSLAGVAIITHHKYWTYLNHWLGLRVAATLEPLPGVSPSSSHLAAVSKIAGQQSVSMIVHVAYVNERPLQWLADKTGLPTVSLPATVDFQSGETLPHWFNTVLDKLNTAYSRLKKAP